MIIFQWVILVKSSVLPASLGQSFQRGWWCGFGTPMLPAPPSRETRMVGSTARCHITKRTCGFMCVNRMGRKTNQCEKYKETEQTLVYRLVRVQRTRFQHSHIAISWLNFVFLYSLWDPRQAFFSDFRWPGFPCGSFGGTTLLLPVTARPARAWGHTAASLLSKAYLYTLLTWNGIFQQKLYFSF